MDDIRRLPRIAVIIPTYGRVGGAENVAYQLCERLAKNRGFDIHVLAHEWDAPDSACSFHHIPVCPFPRWLRPVSFAAFARKAVRHGRYDLVHSHERVFEMDLMSFHGIPHRLWVRHIRKKRSSLFDRATAWVEGYGIQNRNTRKILAISGLVQKSLDQIYPHCKDRIQIFHPGASLNRFQWDHPEIRKTDFRNRLGMDPQDTVMLFVGMNFEIKRLGLVIRAMANLGDSIIAQHRIRLLIVGKGDTAAYRKLASGLGIADHVIFAGVSHQVEENYLSSDFLVMPSRMDTFGLVVLEAMAAGLPAIISGRVGAADLILHGKNGLVLPGDPSVFELSRAMMTLLDPVVRNKMGNAAKQTAKPHDWDAVTNRLAGIYREILAQKQRP